MFMRKIFLAIHVFGEIVAELLIYACLHYPIYYCRRTSAAEVCPTVYVQFITKLADEHNSMQ